MHKVCDRKRNSHSRSDFISAIPELRGHGNERWQTEVTSNTYFRGVALDLQEVSSRGPDWEGRVRHEWEADHGHEHPSRDLRSSDEWGSFPWNGTGQGFSSKTRAFATFFPFLFSLEYMPKCSSWCVAHLGRYRLLLFFFCRFKHRNPHVLNPIKSSQNNV